MDKIQQLSQPIDEQSSYGVNDFIPPPVYGADEFLIDADPTRLPIDNQAVVADQASTLAALSGDPENALQLFTDISHEYSTEGKSDTADIITERVKTQARENDIDTVMDIIRDPSYPDQFKQDVLKAWKDETNKRYNPKTILAERSATEFDPQTPDGEARQLHLLDSLDEVLESREKIQAMMVERAAKIDHNIVKDVGELAAFWVAPFTEGIQVQEAMSAADPNQGAFEWLSAVWKMGDKKMQLQEYLKTLPPEEQVEAHRRMFKALDSSGISFGDFGEFQTMKSIVEGNYDTTDQVLDNLFSILDVMFLGTTKAARRGLFGAAKMGSEASARLSDKIRAATRNRARGQVNHTSVGVIYNDTNPAKAREMAKAILADDTGEAARALLQADRGDAVAHVTMPQVGNEARVVDNIVDAEPPEIAVARKNIEETYTSLRGASATPEELAAAVSNKMAELVRRVSLVSRGPMASIDLEGGRTIIRGVYGPSHGEGGFASAEEAREAAKVAFRNFGIRDESISILEQDGAHYRGSPRVTILRGKNKTGKGKGKDYIVHENDIINSSTTPKSYLAQVDYDYDFNPVDVPNMSDLRPERTQFDRIKMMTGNQSSVTRSLLDPSSIFHPFVTSTGAVASNKTAFLLQNMLKVAENVTKPWSKLPEHRIALLDDIVQEANFLGKKPSKMSLIAAGLSSEEIKILDDFARFFEFEHRIKNLNLIHVQRSKGMKLFVDKNGTQLTVKPVNVKAPVARMAKVKIFDNITGSFRHATQDEIARAYEQGGGLGKVEGGILINDEYAEYILSKNTADEYMRDIMDYDELLNKKEAYYPVKYMNPHFIVRKIKIEGGEHRYVRIATADDKLKAEKILDKLRAERPDVEFDVFPDVKDFQNIVGNMNDSGSMGRLGSQKVRGTRLVSLNERGDLTAESTYIMNPVDTMIYSSRVLSDRVGMRSWLETNKHRFIQSYSKYLPNDEFGNPRFPNDISEIGFRERGSYSEKDLGDARAQYNYLNTVENGFVNLVDQVSKGGLLMMADALGRGAVDAYRLGKHTKADALGAVERGLRDASKHANPIEAARRVTFASLIVSNFARQFIIQAQQGLQGLLLYPREFRKIPSMTIAMLHKHGNLPKGEWLAEKTTGMPEEQLNRMYDSFIKSGLVASIQSHNMVGASLRKMTEAGLGESKLTKALVNPARGAVNAVRKIGFDPGEFTAKAMAYSGAYANKLRKTGNKNHKFSQRELDEIAAEADLLTLSMNRSGEMPWNQNSLSVFFQFMSAPYKQLMLSTTTRRLDKQQKLRLAIGNLMFYGVPSYGVASFMNEHFGEKGKALTKGALDTFVNWVADGMLGDDHGNLDIQKALHPITDPREVGIYKMALAVASNGSLPWTDTPMGSMFDPEKGRIAVMINAMARYSGNWSDDAYESAPDAKALLKYVMDLTAGTSNMFQAYQFIWGTGKVDPKTGEQKVPADVKFGIAKAFGINSEMENVTNWAKFESYKNSSEFKEDVTKVIDRVLADAAASGIGKTESDIYTRSLAAIMQSFGNDPRAHEILAERIRNTKYGQDWARSMMKASGFEDISPQIEAMRVNAGSEEDRAAVDEFIKTWEGVREDIKRDFEESN